MFLKNYWKTIVVIGIPILLLPLIICFQNDASRCAYVILILIIYWITEALPISITSLLPLILFPLVGVLKASQVAPNYFRDMMSLFFGSVTLAYAIQNVNLHRRIALFVLNLVGSSIQCIMAGLMITTWLLSMWINNAASTSVMLPVALAIADECANCTNIRQENEQDLMITDQQNNNNNLSKVETDNIKKSLILSVSYSTIYGGLSTVVGSAITIFLKGYIDEQYDDDEFHLTFFNYSLVAVPASILMLIGCWGWLLIYYKLITWPYRQRDRSTNDLNDNLKKIIKRQYKELGPLRWNEMIVIVLFLLAIILWSTRDLENGKSGWSILFRSKYVTNGTVALLVGVLSMILPNDRPFMKNWTYKPIVEWNDLSKNFPWGTMILLGAGLSIAHAAKVSKLLNIFANVLKFVHNAPPVIILIILLIISIIFTQLISSLSMASILFPIIGPMASSTNIRPAYLFVPCTIVLSQSFLLPISSQPNAIIFSTGFLSFRDLITTGIVMSTIGGLITLLTAHSLMIPVFDLKTILVINSTLLNITSPHN